MALRRFFGESPSVDGAVLELIARPRAKHPAALSSQSDINVTRFFMMDGIGLLM
jgi:hypothetical protein